MPARSLPPLGLVLALICVPTVVSAAPISVTVVGSLQSELGCATDWDPACAFSMLALEAGDQVWQETFVVPAGSWEYKVALDGSFAENYGLNATPGGANISFTLAAPTAVKFYYSDETHWATSSADSVIAIAPGSFQNELGCSGDWQPDCLLSWLQDPDGDGIFLLDVLLPPGSYETKVALNEDWTINYGAGGVPGGPNIGFVVPAGALGTLFQYDSSRTSSPSRAACLPRRSLLRWS
jgi:pullulanase